MELNDEKELEGFLSETPEAPEEEVEEGEAEEKEEEPKETEEDQDDQEDQESGEEVEALTPREQALIAQFTETPEDSYDPSVPPAQTWEAQSYQFFKEGESIDDILADPARFNAKMQEFYNDALQKGAQMALEATYRSLPRTVSTYAKQQIETVNLVNDFYNRNKDLVPLKPALARIAQKIGTEHPEYTLTQLLTESAKTAREVFKVPESKPKEKPKTPSPAFVGQKGGNNRVASNRSIKGKSLEDQVMDLIS